MHPFRGWPQLAAILSAVSLTTGNFACLRWRQQYCTKKLTFTMPFLRLLLVAFLSSWATCVVHGSSYLAACLIVKNELEYLPEWIEYHRRMGISKFYVFDHNSSVPVINSISKYVSTDQVEYFFTDFHWAAGHHYPNFQIATYHRCLQRYGKLHKFMAFIDSDEFIVVVDKTKRIPDILADYEQFGGVVMNWMVFGSSGHIATPPGGVLANYYKCFKNGCVKTIVNTEYTLKPGGNPHQFLYTEGHFAVSAGNKTLRVNGAVNLQLHTAFDTMYINHYNTRSYEDYVRKANRGRVTSDPHKLNDEHFHGINRQAQWTCPILEMPPAEWAD
jgi:hypothetical protein